MPRAHARRHDAVDRNPRIIVATGRGWTTAWLGSSKLEAHRRVAFENEVQIFRRWPFAEVLERSSGTRHWPEERTLAKEGWIPAHVNGHIMAWDAAGWRSSLRRHHRHAKPSAKIASLLPALGDLTRTWSVRLPAVSKAALMRPDPAPPKMRAPAIRRAGLVGSSIVVREQERSRVRRPRLTVVTTNWMGCQWPQNAHRGQRRPGRGWPRVHVRRVHTLSICRQRTWTLPRSGAEAHRRRFLPPPRDDALRAPRGAARRGQANPPTGVLPAGDRVSFGSVLS